MTVENCIKALKAYKKNMEDPRDINGRSLTGNARVHALKVLDNKYKNMVNHIKTSRKFQGHPILEELDPKKPVKAKKETKEKNGR